MKKHYVINVKGKVQGVYFRASTQEYARNLGLKGWVKNQPDGSVQICAEGPEDALDTLVEWCGTGPPSAEVENVESKEGALKHFNHFEVRY